MTMHSRPNLLLVLADDLGQGDVSAFNPNAAWITPHLDRLAAQGMRFMDSHSTSALCTPSRYSLLTGRYNWRSRLKSMVLPGDSAALIERDRVTMPMFLREQGYRTAVVGKWHLGLDWALRPGGDSPEAFGLDDAAYRELIDLNSTADRTRGGRNGNFDFWRAPVVEGIDIDYSKPVSFGPAELGFEQSFVTAASLDQPPYVYIDNGVPSGVPGEISGDEWKLDRVSARHQNRTQRGPAVTGYDVHQVAQDFQDRALQVLDEFLRGEDPWFLYVPSHLVHGPIIPGAPWRGRSGAGPYGDFVLQFDAYVGELLSRIDEHGAADNTIVIVTSDNGPSGVADIPLLRDEHGHDPSNGWRGKKSDIWEGGHRTPTIVRWPGTVKAGSISTQLVSHSDVFATIADVLEVALPEDVAEDSISSLAAWCGSATAVRADIVSHSGGGGFAIREGDWKLEFTTTGDGMDSLMATGSAVHTEYRAAQLYNLAVDPAESDNRIEHEPVIVQHLTERLATYIRTGRSTRGTALGDTRAAIAEWPQLAWLDEV